LARNFDSPRVTRAASEGARQEHVFHGDHPFAVLRCTPLEQNFASPHEKVRGEAVGEEV